MGVLGQNQNQGNGIFGRLLIACVIALVGFFMYMSDVQVNPITGEKQHVALTPNEEIKLGIDSAPAMAQEMGGEVPESDPRLRTVQRIGQQIVDNTNARKSPWKFKFHLLKDTKTVNAFALPGGQIFITLGLYNKLQDEAQLAGVLSHEMGHVIERHSAQQMAKTRLGQTLVIAVGTGISRDDASAQHSMMIASVVNQMMQLRYSRGDESEADIWGLKLMAAVGYNPYAMIEVMKILKAEGAKGKSVEIFQTHPDPDRRIKQIQEYLLQHPAAKNLSNGRRLQTGFIY